MVIQVTVGTNLKKVTKPYPDTVTPRQILEGEHIDFSRGTTHMCGVPLSYGDFDKTLAELHAPSPCFLLNVAKADNA